MEVGDLMASERLNKAKDRLNAYYAAELAVLSGQEYRMGTKTMRRADLAEIRQAIKDLEALVNELESVESGRGCRKAFRITPRDL
ncbi:DUF6148 family protein [Clostridium thermosuccinogenes]|uniref:DUF6148 family protein n=1 Tax=Clostridium thermosuccinogenes TaxID=84032 RepID=UPI000CCE0E48|nr:DUF6148 family protein [Pseudoclostridium thermosuccinogenes]PNT91280.1 hypothetical protein CDQ83_15875 [Pseudoclostridium thermosuccinogenes]